MLPICWQILNLNRVDERSKKRRESTLRNFEMMMMKINKENEKKNKTLPLSSALLVDYRKERCSLFVEAEPVQLRAQNRRVEINLNGFINLSVCSIIIELCTKLSNEIIQL